MLPVIVYDPKPEYCSELRQYISEYGNKNDNQIKLIAGTSSAKDAASYIESSGQITLVVLGVIDSDSHVFDLGWSALKINRDNYVVYLLHTNNRLEELVDNCIRPAGIITQPYDERKLISTLDRIRHDYSGLVSEGTDDYLVLTGASGTYRLLMNRILYLEASEKKVTVWTNRQSVSVRMTIGALEEMLPKERFLRCHRSYIVNKDYISDIDYTNMIIRLTGGEEVFFSRSFRADVKQIFDGRRETSCGT